MRKYRNSDGHSDRALPHKLTWRDVLEGHLVDLLSSTYDGEGQLAEAEIQGKPLEVYDSPNTPAFTGSKADDVADEVAKLLCDQMRNAAEGGLAVTFKLAARNHRVDQATDDRKLGGIQAELAATLRRSSKLKATLAKRHSIPENRGAKRAAWLGRSSRTAADGRPEFDPGSAFNLKTAVSIWRIFERYIAGDSLEQIRKYLEDARLPPPGVSSKPLAIGRKVHPWQVEMVSYQLHSAAAIGLHHGAEINLHSPHPPQPVNPALLSWRTFRLVQDLLSTPLSGGRPNAANLLSGRIFCLRCRDDGRDRQPMESATRSGGKQLLCGHARAAHMGPPYDAFEAELLNWLKEREDIAPELDQILAATKDQLKNCMGAFSWPPPDATSPDSLEDAVLAHRGASENKSNATSPDFVKNFIEKLNSEPLEQKQEKMRRKMRNVLRRHIDKVYVSAKDPMSLTKIVNPSPNTPLDIQNREAVPLFYSMGTIFNSDGELQRDVRLFNVDVHRVGRDAPDPAFVIALSVGRFEMPPNTDWEQILLAKRDDEPAKPRPQVPPDGSAVNGLPSSGPSDKGRASATSQLTTDSTASSVAQVAWTGYQPRSRSTASLPWGVHMRGEDLDELSDAFYNLPSSDRPDLWSARQLTIKEADLLAYGMLLYSLNLFARFDNWLIEILERAVGDQDLQRFHQLIYESAFPTFGNNIDIDQDLTNLTRRRTINSLDQFINTNNSTDPSDKDITIKSLANLKPGHVLLSELADETKNLHQVMCAAALLEGLKWASEFDGRSTGKPGLWGTAMRALMCCDVKHYFAASPLSVYFEAQSTWDLLTARLLTQIEQKLEPGTFGVLRALDHVDLRAALQAKSFPPSNCSSGPAKVYLHGDGRVVGILRARRGTP